MVFMGANQKRSGKMSVIKLTAIILSEPTEHSKHPNFQRKKKNYQTIKYINETTFSVFNLFCYKMLAPFQ